MDAYLFPALNKVTSWLPQNENSLAALRKDMPPNQTTLPIRTLAPGGLLNRVLGSLSIFTMVMAVPQVLTIWVRYQAAGISMLSWGSYFLSAAVWLWYGLD
jgi:hypothetical protein